MLPSGQTDFKISNLWLVILFIFFETMKSTSNNSTFKNHFPEETFHFQSIQVCENVVFHLFLFIFSSSFILHICFFYWLVQVCMRNVRFYGTVVRADCGTAAELSNQILGACNPVQWHLCIVQGVPGQYCFRAPREPYY